MRKFTLFFAALLMSLGIQAQHSADDYYSFAAEITGMRKITNLSEITDSMEIMIKHSHEGTAQSDHEGSYLTIYSLVENGTHTVFMQTKPVGVGVWTADTVNTKEGTFTLTSAHGIIKKTPCYLGKLGYNSTSQAYLSTTGNENYAGVYKFAKATDGSDRWNIQCTNNTNKTYLSVTEGSNGDPTLGEASKVDEHCYFELYEVTGKSAEMVQYVTNAKVYLIGPAGNVVETTHTGWSDFYEFVMYSGSISNSVNYGISVLNTAYHSQSNTITADITYPFSVSGDVSKVPIHLCPSGESQRIAIVDGALKVLTSASEHWTKNDGNQWYIYPKYDSEKKNFYYAIQNVETKQFLKYNSTDNGVRDITLVSLSEGQSISDLSADCFFFLEGATNGRVQFAYKGKSSYGNLATFYLCRSGEGVSSTGDKSDNMRIEVSNVSATELNGVPSIGFTRYFHEDTYFWDGGEVALSSCPTSVQTLLKKTDSNHEAAGQGTHKVFTAKTAITVTQPGAVTVTFNYITGDNALVILGVDIVDASNRVQAQKYAIGKAGNPSADNFYILSDVGAGKYFLRYWVCNRTDLEGEVGHNLKKVRGSITVAGANYRWEPAKSLDWVNATWYRMRLSDGLERYISAANGYVDGENLTLTNNTPPADYAGLWTMVGDAENGYKFYNRAKGADYALKTDGEGANARTYLAPVAEASTYDVVQQDGNYQFFVKLHGTDNYLYKQGDYLATAANALGDANAVMTFETVNSTSWTEDLTLKTGLYTLGVDENIQRGYVCANATYNYPVLTEITLSGYTQNSATAMENGKIWYVLAIDQDSYVFYNMGNGKYLVNSNGDVDGVVDFGDNPYIWNLSKNGAYTLIQDPWHNNNKSQTYLSGGCGRTAEGRPMAWDSNKNDGGAKYTLTATENVGDWDLEALKTQIKDALAQDLPLTLTYDKGTLSTTCKAINQVDKVQALQETFELTGYTGATLGEIGFTNNGELAATLTFPEGFIVQTPVTLSAFNADNFKWFASDSNVRVIKDATITASTDKYYQWKIIPVLNGKNLAFTVQNIGAGTYIYTAAADGTQNHGEGAVTLAENGTHFIPASGWTFAVNGMNALWLSVNSKNTGDQFVGVWNSTHDGTKTKITAVELATSDEIANAKDIIKTGPGYPKTTTTEYAELNALTEGNSKSVVTGALEAYRACTDIDLPEDGKAYKISAWWRTRTLPLAFIESTNVSGLYAPAYVPTEGAEGAVFVCRKMEDGTYAFVTDNGYYLGWQTDNSNSNATSKTYSDGTHWKVQKAVTGSSTGDLKQTELLGKLLLYANGTSGSGKDWYAYMFSYGSKHFHNAQANELYYGDAAHTVYYTFEEVSANTLIEVGLATIQESDELLIGSELTGKTIGTFSAPYATVIPEGVTAYYAAEAEEAGQLILKPVDGDALPAEQGVVLIGNASSATMLPVAGENVATIDGNEFAHSATEPVTMGANAYILANGGQGIGIYKATEGSTLKQGKAYLNFTGSSANSFVLNFSGVTTDIEGAPTVALSQQVIYDLSGRRVNAVTKGGIYIVNGKKMIIK